MDPVGNILGRQQDRVKTLFKPGTSVTWDSGDGSATVTRVDAAGVDFAVVEFSPYGHGETTVERRSWAWIKNNLNFFDLHKNY